MNKISCMNAVAVVSAALILTNCAAEVPSPQQDASVVLGKVIDLSKKKFARESCYVRSLAPPSPPSAGGSDWTSGPENKVRFRLIKTPAVEKIPPALLAGLSTTGDRYGCSQTIHIQEPQFFEVQEGQKAPGRIAVVGVDDLCGPVCGEALSVTFSLREGVWVAEGAGLTSTGVMF
jgi:hypothetical protein